MKKYHKYLQVGFRSDGSRIRKHFYGSSQAELDQNIRNYFIQASKTKNPSDITFGAYAKKWQEIYKANKSAATREMYSNALKKMDAIDLMELRKITKTDCQQVVNQYAGRRTAEILKMTLKQIFNTAIDDGIISSNPARNLELLKRKADEKRAFTKEEKEIIKKAKLPTMERMFVNILLTFGLRPGEALALSRFDIDFNKKILHITKSVEFDGNNPNLKGTKTEVSRDIPIPNKLLKYIRKYIAEDKNTLLFHKRDGSLMTKSSYVKFTKRILDEIGLPITMYYFRHNRATELYYLCQKGIISTKKAAALMGHSELIFLKTYSHLLEEKENTKELYKDLAI